MRVMIDASQVTTGVTPEAEGVQYCKLIGIVKMLVLGISCGDPPGGVKKMLVVFRKLWAFRKIS